MEPLEVRVKKQLIESMNNCGIIFDLSDQPEDIQNQDLNAEQASEMIASEYLHEYESAGNIEIFAAVGKYLGDMDREYPGYFMEKPKSNITLIAVYKNFNLHRTPDGRVSIWNGMDHIGMAPDRDAAVKFIDEVVLIEHPELDPDDAEYRPELDEGSYPNRIDSPAPPMKLGRTLYQQIERAVKITGTFDPDQSIYIIEEQLTPDEYKLIRAFMNWLFINGRTIGSGNYEQEFRSFMESANPIREIDPADVPCMGCGRKGCDESGKCVE